MEYASPYWVLKPNIGSQPVYRFVDTSSRVDLVSYKSTFINNPSTEPIEYTLQVYESDDLLESATPFWIPNQISGQTDYLFIQRCKRFVKFEVEFFTDLSEEYFIGATPTIDFVLLVEVQIADPIPPNTTYTTRDIVQKFPSWTKIFEDSFEGATPRFDIPQSLGGKLINATVGDHLDKVETLLDFFELNKSISGADTESLSWIYVTNNVPNAINSVRGDDIQLSMITNYSDFISHTVDDYVYYFNPMDRVILTLKKFTRFKINNTNYNQSELLVFNIFDEFGLRVGLPRLKLESNERYKQRILDVYLNKPSGDVDSFKKTIRRELDLWRALGSTPDSYYPGATPVVLEMQDIERLNNYFEENGNPTKQFVDFIQLLNEQYPTNWGFVPWTRLIWDYAGRLGQGVSKVPFVYDNDINSSTPTKYYQHGVGDLSDLKLSIKAQNDFSSDENILNDISDEEVLQKQAYIRVSGVEKISEKNIYPPINVDFDYYTEYEYLRSNSPAATVNYVVELENGGVTYYANVTKYASNRTAIADSQSTPDYLIHDIFSPVDNRTENSLRFRNKNNNSYYLDYSATPVSYRMPARSTSRATIKYGQYLYSSTPRYVISNHTSTNKSYLAIKDSAPIFSTSYLNGTHLEATPSLTYASPSFSTFHVKYGSDMYSYSVATGYTPAIRRRITLDPYNDLGQSATPSVSIAFSELSQNIYSSWGGSTPKYVHVDNVKPADAYIDPDYATPSNRLYNGYGGFTYHPEFNNNFYVPHILISADQSSKDLFSTPRYDISYGASTPQYLNISWDNTTVISSEKYYKQGSNVAYNYPLTIGQWQYFEKLSATPITFNISERGIVHGSGSSNTNSKFDDVIYNADVHRYSFDFNQTVPSKYILNYIEAIPANENDNTFSVWVDKNNVRPYYTISQDDDLRISNVSVEPSEYYNEVSDGSSSDLYIEDVVVRAKLENKVNPHLESEIHTGWYYLDGEESYVYARPITETHINSNSTPNFIATIQPARQGAPVIVELVEYPNIKLNQISFVDENDYTKSSFQNIETITAKDSNSMYLGYRNVYDVSVFDPIANAYVIQGASSETEKITVSQSATPVLLVDGRDYIVRYKVRNSYYIDNESYSSTNDLETVIHFGSTPMFGATPVSGPFTYRITYESSIFDMATPTGIYHSPLKSLNSESFVYLSNQNYEYDRFVAQMNPASIVDSKHTDYSILTIESMDINSNPKPYQTYQITSSLLSATPSIVTTNEDGFATVELRYNGVSPATASSGIVYVSGVQSGESTANDNATINYQIIKSQQTENRLIAEPSRQTVKADGQSSLYVNGKIVSTSNNVSGVRVYYRKGRLINTVMTSSYDNYVTTSSDGSFSIGPIVSQNAATPGYWFMAVESELSTSIDTTPETIVGDIVHWFEDSDDVITSNSTRIYPIQESYTVDQLTYYYATPSYKISYLTGDPSASSGPTSISFPAWFKIPRYIQYQMGILGNEYYEYDNSNTVYPS
jgi:hypothetical protein